MEKDFAELHKKIEDATEKRCFLDDMEQSLSKIIERIGKETGEDVPSELVSLKKKYMKRSRKTSGLINGLQKLLKAKQAECDHDFAYVEETYGGNFSIYECKKCGMIEWRK